MALFNTLPKCRESHYCIKVTVWHDKECYEMTTRRKSVQNGWMSLPVIALLLVVSTFSVRYQEALFASYKWRGQLSDVAEEQEIWRVFHEGFVGSPSFNLANLSVCVGFCTLTRLQNTNQEKEWRHDGETLNYQWTRYEKLNVDTSLITTSYRLCATQTQQTYLCWWWRDSKLLSSGWVSIN